MGNPDQDALSRVPVLPEGSRVSRNPFAFGLTQTVPHARDCLPDSEDP